jgi:2-oxoglutarate dehydrogenase E2 component (dihydrolipoamide succinyltransferase)
MPTEVIMPQMGESIFEGTITRWLKQVGDPVQKDEPLFEISTDKVDAEIPSPVAGVLSEIRIPEGATVQINTIVGVVSEAGEAPSSKASPAASVASATAEPAKAAPPAAPTTGGAEIVMPQMGESIFEGTIVKWLKQAGDMVQKDEPLFEISTDKVDAEIPSPVAGVLTEIKVPEGATVEVNTVVAIVGGGVFAPAPPISAPPAAPPASPAPPAPPAVNTSERIRSSPLVRRICREHNLDLRSIPGTGAGGRITKEDALRHLSERQAAPATAAPPQPSPAVAPIAPPPSPLAGQVVPLSRMRAIIAQRMVESVRISPHVHTVFRVDMSRIVRLREREKAAYEQRNGVRLTYMPFIAAAAVDTLRKFPIVNASLVDGAIHYHHNINLGIAVALEWGLIVPVVRQAEERSFLGLARAIADLAERARARRLLPAEVSGNTFTLTNSGIFGEEFGTPIVNQPDSAIMAIGALRKEPVVLTDAEGNDTIAIRSMQHFCLGFDHRTIDGADAGRFMAEFKRTLEAWDKEIG